MIGPAPVRYGHTHGRPCRRDDRRATSCRKRRILIRFAPVLQSSEARRKGPVGVERLLTVMEVAERLRVCTATVYGLCKSGKLGHVRVANSIRIREAELRRLGG